MTRTGAQVVARCLAEAGVRWVFSLSGNQILSLYEALDRAGIGIVHTRHEGAAVHMADAWARLTGEVGVCLVTAGPGHANALGALAMAGAGESPVVLLSGHAPSARAGQGAFQEMNQVALARPLTRWSAVAERTAHLPTLIATAFRHAQTGRYGPTQVSLPVDVLEGPADDLAQDAEPGPQQAAYFPTPAPPDTAAVRRIVALLREAARPVVVAGAWCARMRGHAALAAFSQHTGVPFLVVDHPRGLADPGLGRAAKALAAADTALLFGKTQDYRLNYGAPPAIAHTCRLLQIDPVLAEIGRHRAVEDGMVAELLPTAAALLEAAREVSWSLGSWTREVAALKETPVTVPTPADPSVDDGLHPWSVLDGLASLVAKQDVCFVLDGGEFGQWGRARLRPSPPHHLVNEPSGAIGFALPFAIASKLARPDAMVVALTGDGAFGFHAVELETAARLGVPVLVVVGNDAKWGTERHLQHARYGPDRGVATDLLPARYDLLAAALGCHGEYVERQEEIKPAFQRAAAALAGGRPAVVNARIRSVPSPAGAPP